VQGEDDLGWDDLSTSFSLLDDQRGGTGSIGRQSSGYSDRHSSHTPTVRKFMGSGVEPRKEGGGAPRARQTRVGGRDGTNGADSRQLSSSEEDLLEKLLKDIGATDTDVDNESDVGLDILSDTELASDFSVGNDLRVSSSPSSASTSPTSARKKSSVPPSIHSGSDVGGSGIDSVRGGSRDGRERVVPPLSVVSSSSPSPRMEDYNNFEEYLDALVNHHSSSDMGSAGRADSNVGVSSGGAIGMSGSSSSGKESYPRNRYGGDDYGSDRDPKYTGRKSEAYGTHVASNERSPGVVAPDRSLNPATPDSKAAASKDSFGSLEVALEDEIEDELTGDIWDLDADIMGRGVGLDDDEAEILDLLRGIDSVEFGNDDVITGTDIINTTPRDGKWVDSRVMERGPNGYQNRGESYSRNIRGGRGGFDGGGGGRRPLDGSGQLLSGGRSGRPQYENKSATKSWSKPGSPTGDRKSWQPASERAKSTGQGYGSSLNNNYKNNNNFNYNNVNNNKPYSGERGGGFSNSKVGGDFGISKGLAKEPADLQDFMSTLDDLITQPNSDEDAPSRRSGEGVTREDILGGRTVRDNGRRGDVAEELDDFMSSLDDLFQEKETSIQPPPAEKGVRKASSLVQETNRKSAPAVASDGGVREDPQSPNVLAETLLIDSASSPSGESTLISNKVKAGSEKGSTSIKPSSTPVSSDKLDSLKVVDLQAILREKGLSVSGKKAVLIQRIKDAVS